MEHVIAFYNIKNVQMLQRHKGQWQCMFIQTLIMTHKRRWHKLSTQLWMSRQTRFFFSRWTSACKEVEEANWKYSWISCDMNAQWTTITTGHELLWIFDSTMHSIVKSHTIRCVVIVRYFFLIRISFIQWTMAHKETEKQRHRCRIKNHLT